MTQFLCSAFLFDMDGVLINSTPAVARVWRNWALERGFDPEVVVRKAHGRPSMTTIRELLPHADHEAENREIERCEMTDVQGVVPLSGAEKLLRSLPPERWAIVTSCTAPLARTRLEVAGIPQPKYLITANDVSNGKPHPEPYLKGAALLGFPADECVVVEDVPAGIRAGREAGARVIALRSTVAEPELAAAGANWIVNDCAGISVCTNGTGKLHVTLNL